MRYRVIFSTNLKDYQAFQLEGEPVYKRYKYLKELLDQHLEEGFSQFLALPKIKGDEAEWRGVGVSETIIPLSQASEEQKAHFLKLIDDKFARLEELIQNLSVKYDSQHSEQLAKRLELSIYTPNEDHIFIDPETDSFWFVAWGFEYLGEKKNARTTLLPKLTKKLPPLADKKPGLQEVASTSSKETLDPAPTQESEASLDKKTEQNTGEPVPLSDSDKHSDKEPDTHHKESPFKQNLRKYLPWLLGLLLLLALLYIFCFLPQQPELVGTDEDILQEILPEQPDIFPPFDSTKVIIDEEDPLKQTIISNRLNIYLTAGTDVNSFSLQLKQKYPDPSIQIVFYSKASNRLMIQCPANQRKQIEQELKEMKHVEFIMDETIFNTNSSAPFNDPGFSNSSVSWPYEKIQLYDAWSITKGDPSVLIAVIDNGFDLRHEELFDQNLHSWNIPGNTNKTDIGYVNMIHGTHVAGIAGAKSDNREGSAGIAPFCKIMPIQVGNAFGVMTTSAIVDGIFYAMHHDATVINLSLGSSFTANFKNMPVAEQERLAKTLYPQQEKFWTKLFKLLHDKGIVVVQAAGNANVLASIDPMQRNPYTIKVSATNPSNRKANFSNFGEVCQLSAPGTQIYSSIPGNNYKVLDGTSMAAPIVSGAVALLKSNNPSLTPQQCKDILYQTGLNVGADIGRLIQLADALGYEGEAGNPCQEEIERLKEEIENLKDQLEDSSLGLIIPDDPEDLSFAEGVWKSTTDLFSTVDHEKIELYFEFNKDGSGELTIVEEDGEVCKAPLQVSLYPNKMEIDQLTDAICPAPNPDYNPYVVRCISLPNRVAKCTAINSVSKAEVEFSLIKVRNY